MSTCPSCSTTVDDRERFCEACGAALSPGDPEVPTAATAAPATADPTAATAAPATADAEAADAEAAVCSACGGAVAADGYCETCGARAVIPRDHVVEQPAPWVAAVCDRGVRHARNEDAVATAADPEPGSRAVLVVCDGVSSSIDPDVASLAAARAARDVLAASHPRGLGTASSRVALITSTLAKATDAASAAVLAATAEGSLSPASCTLVAAVLDGALLVVGWVGDSRAYWLPDDGAASAADGRRLLRGRADRPRGAPARGRERPARARDHPLARRGRPATTRRGRSSLDLTTPGWVLVCSDGLWNYCSEAHDLGAPGASTRPRRAGADAARPGRCAGRLGQRPGWPGQHHGGPRPRTDPAPCRRRADTASVTTREEVPRDGTSSPPSVYQNEFLPDGGTDVHAIVTVACTGAGEAGQSGDGRRRRDHHRRHLRLDGQPDKIAAAQAAAAAALDQIARRHAGSPSIAGSHQAPAGLPAATGSPRMVRMDAQHPRRGQGRGRPASAPTAAPRWAPGCTLAARLFASVPGVTPAARHPAHRRR